MKKEEKVKIMVNKENYNYFKDLEETIVFMLEILQELHIKIKVLYVIVFLLFLMLIIGW